MSYPYFQISKKSIYAVQALLELALRKGAEPVNVQRLSRTQGIPPRFLEVILNELKQGGFVTSVRGRAGGYLLAKDSGQITIGQIIHFFDRNNNSEKAVSSAFSGNYRNFAISSIINDINRTISEICDNTNLKDMAGLEMKNKGSLISNYVI